MKEASCDISRYMIHFSVFNNDTVKHSQMRTDGVEAELNVPTQNLSFQAPNLKEKDLVDLEP